VIAEIMAWDEDSVSKIIRKYVSRGAATAAIIKQMDRGHLQNFAKPVDKVIVVSCETPSLPGLALRSGFRHLGAKQGLPGPLCINALDLQRKTLKRQKAPPAARREGRINGRLARELI
jgi:hypothetical protein